MTVSASIDAGKLDSLIQQFAGRRVLVLGDLILDRYVWGDTERTSPEAPVPVVRWRQETETLGGASNVVANLCALGGRPLLVGVTGADSEGDALMSHLAEMGVATSGVVIDRTRPTTVKTRFISHGQQLLRLDREQAGALTEPVVRALMKKYEAALRRAEIVILSDYGKGIFSEEVCRHAIALAHKAGLWVMVDPKGAEWRKYRGADLLTPNQKEAQEASGIKVESAEDLSLAAERLARITGSRAMVITRGAQGVSVFQRRRPPLHVPAQARAVFDVTGAGDSFIATLAMTLAAGGTVAEAAALGNAAGSIVVAKLGAATATPYELRAAVHPGGASLKLRSAVQLKAEIESLRAAGKRIVFTNGCFDLIHPGQIRFLEMARRLGDVLVVGLNSDRSVREVKGPPRPILKEEERAAILGALEAVSYLVIFDEPTPERLLDLLRPDVLVKGKGIAKGDAVGHKIVKSHGGRVEILPLLGEMTTEEVVNRIANGTKPR